MKRFYRTVEAVPAAQGFGVALDGKPLRTPAKATLLLPSRALAAAVATEWRDQDTEIDPRSMPLTRLASTALDVVAPRRDAIVAETAGYAATDLVCYRAAHPPELVARQMRSWQPLLDWAEDRFAAPLRVTTGVVPVAQPPASVAALVAAVAAHEPMSLAALRLATAVAGSLVIALALMERRLDAEGAFAAAELDESFEIAAWGEDPERTRHRAGLRDDLGLAERFASLLQSDA